MIGGKCGIEFGVGLSEATRHWIKGVVAYQALSDYLAHKLIYFTKSSAFNNANISVVIPICVLRSFGLKGTFYSSHLLPVTLPITDRLMQNSSREKCAGIQAFIFDFQSSTFGVCSSFLFSVSVLPFYGAWKSREDMHKIPA